MKIPPKAGSCAAQNQVVGRSHMPCHNRHIRNACITDSKFKKMVAEAHRRIFQERHLELPWN
jgi:hypothetical protein